MSQLSRARTLLQSQVEELKKQLDEEVKVSVHAECSVDVGESGRAARMKVSQMCGKRLRVCQCKQVVSGALSSVRQEADVLKEQLEEEQESKQEMQRLVSKLNSEVTHWRSKHEADAIQHADELEETKCVVLTQAADTFM